MGQVEKVVSKMAIDIVIGKEQDEEESVTCSECSEQMDVGSGLYIVDDHDNEIYCEDCSRSCDDCSKLFHFDRNTHRFANVCIGCEDDWFYCDRCGEVDHLDNSNTVDSHESWCSSCAESWTEGWCDRHESYETDMCHRGSGHVQSYDYDPYIGWQYNGMDLPFSLENLRKHVFFGVELEVESDGDGLDDGAVAVLEHFNKSTHVNDEKIIYLKQDGSIDDGFEIVTQPMTFEYAMGLDWSILTRLAGMGFRSWNGGACGIHVHVSRTAFKDRQHLWKFTQLINGNNRECAKLAGRDSQQWSRFDKKESSQAVLGKRFAERYQAVNLQNSRTVEVRIFRGSLRVDRVPMAIQFVESCTEYTKDLTINQVSRGALAWSMYEEFVRSNKEKYKELITIIDEKVR